MPYRVNEGPVEVLAPGDCVVLLGLADTAKTLGIPTILRTWSSPAAELVGAG